MSPLSDTGRLAIYPGTFDPVHLGHLDLARRAARLFDHLIVAVYERPRKNVLFSSGERVAFFQRALSDLPNVTVEGYEELTVMLARRRAALALIRGLRATSDFDYEYQQTGMNRHLEPTVETVFLMTAVQHAFLSSSLIKEVAAQGAPLDGLVPDHVARALQDRFGVAE